MDIQADNYILSDDFSDFVNLPRRLYRGDPFYMGREEKYTGETRQFTVTDGANALARCCAIINPSISYNGLKTGMIGFFEAFKDEAAVNFLFQKTIEYFKEKGIEFVVGPVNGSIWNNFRVTLPNEKYPEFFLENYHKSYYKDLFEDFGFKPVKNYISTLYKDIKKDYSRVEKFDKYFEKKGVKIRKVNMDNFEEDLESVRLICIEAFKNFEMFAPVSYEEFSLRYLGVRPLINPEYFLIAERGGVPCAFIFAINNLYESIHFTYKKTLIIRHIASNLNVAPAGLGTYLAEKMHAIAASRGFDEIIHSMMDRDVNSSIIYSKNSEIIREYKLYGLEIK